MPKHSLSQRIERIVSDAMIDPSLDIRGRWAKVVEDGIADGVIAAIGPMEDVTLDDVPLAEAIDYAAADADATFQLAPMLDAEITSMGLKKAEEIDLAVIPMIARMEEVGMLIDRDHFKQLEVTFDEYQQTLTDSIQAVAGPDFSPSSPDQVADLLFERLGLATGRRTKSGKRQTTDDKALEALKYSHPVVPLLLEYREVAKLRSTYCILPDFADDTDRIHPDLTLARVPSGRLAASDPNLLAIPTRTELGKEIRRGFIAPPGCVLASADLNQIEMKVMAHLSQDERMLEAFHTGTDIHIQTGSLMFGCKKESVTDAQRHHGKQVGFGIINGITASGYVDQMYLRGAWKFDERDYQSHLAEAQRMIDLYLTEAYPGIRTFLQSVWDEGRRLGYVRCAISGRIWRLPGLRSSIDKVRSEAERQAGNFMIQCGAQSVLKLGMALEWDFLTDWWNHVSDRLEPLLQVHDEVVHEVSADIADAVGPSIVDCLTSGIKLSVPVTASWHTGQTWADLK